MNKKFDNVKFSSGQTLITKGISDLLTVGKLTTKEVNAALKEHFTGEWENLDPSDQAVNEEGARNKGMVMTVHNEQSHKFWIITDPGHEVTTVLLPSEY